MQGPFIVLDGPDKSGKSAHAALLARHLRGLGRSVTHTREPGGTSFAEAVRRIVLDPRHEVRPLAELFLYEAARAQHTQERILPALRAGDAVLCERYTLATLAYQGCARGLPLPLVRSLNRIATGGLRPSLTVVLDVAPREFDRRDRGRRRDRLERESALFRRRVREGYLRLARSEPRTVVLDASRSLRTVQEDLRRIVLKALARRRP